MTTDGAGTPLVGHEVTIQETRDALRKNSEMAIGHLIYAALDHASTAISHPDHTLEAGISLCNSKPKDQWIDEAKSVMTKVWQWARTQPIKVSLMVIGLGIPAFKAKFVAQHMLDAAASSCEWCRRQGFVALISIPLNVSTLVPPNFPGIGIIQAATPDEQKWTAMPCFLLASVVAGAWPYILEKFLQAFIREDFYFTMLAKRFADNYPLTCWTGPAMREAFHHVYQSGVGDDATLKTKVKYGKLGASFAVIVGHVVPFMGAQTTIMQRFFLPHPLDTIVSQPFGMTEDLVSMAMAEATSNPVLASTSLTALIVMFNLARGLVFTGHTADDHADEQDRKVKDVVRMKLPYIALAFVDVALQLVTIAQFSHILTFMFMHRVLATVQPLGQFKIEKQLGEEIPNMLSR